MNMQTLWNDWKIRFKTINMYKMTAKKDVKQGSDQYLSC